MKGTDKFLIALVAGIVVLVGAVVAVSLWQPNRPSYQADDTPEGVAHNYLLALQQEDYARAYGYLSPTLPGYPEDLAQFERDIARYPDYLSFYSSPAGVTLTIERVRVSGDRATVVVRETIYDRGGLFAGGQSSFTFDMGLHRHQGSWKVERANRYWSFCWEQAEGCR